MSLSLDHVVILVKDLAAARADFEALGFQVVPGGEHADGATHNALIAFQDGTYLELLAFRREAPSHRWWRWTALGEGLIDFALLPADIEQDMAGMRERGLAMTGPTPGGRLRPDGQALQWQTGLPPSPELPFLCADVTPRSLRVPQGAASQHSNGVTGLASLTVLVWELAASADRYQSLLGFEPEPAYTSEDDISGALAYRVGSTSLIIAEPIQPGPLADYLARRGESLYRLELLAAGRPLEFDRTKTHGVNLRVVGA